MSDQTTQAGGPHPYGHELRRMGPYVVAALLSLAIFFWVTDLWKADFKVLFTYYIGGDLFYRAAAIKGLMENGSYLVNPNLGAPFGLQTYDFPTSEAFHFLQLRLLNVLTGNYAATTNLLYVLSYPLTALSALWVFRRFDIGAIPGVVGSLLYTFLAAHFWRGLPHLTLACYYLVPLLFWVVLTIGIPGGGEPSGGWREILKSRWFLGRLAVCAASASCGLYYSFFGMFFLACSGLFAWAVYKYRTGCLAALVLAGATLATSLCNVLPNLIFWAREGANQAAVFREPNAAEVYGLKITHLLLPNPGHRVAFLAELRRFYVEQRGATEASVLGGFGLIGGLGFILLLACSLFRYRGGSRDRAFELLGTLNLMGVLLATVGGFGSILSFLGFQQIRAYNRISVFLAFLAFMAVGLVWRRLEESLPAGSRPFFILVSLLVAVFGLWDEIPVGVAPNYALSSAQWMQDASYVALLESSTPPGSMIFQLPYIPFPEYPPVVEMTDYSHFRPYLHSKHLRWSYGTIKGRKGAAWMETTSTLPVPQMVTAVAGAGYAGVYIDRFGYADHAAALESQLAGLLGTTPIVSGDNRLCYFGLGALARKDAGQVAALAGVGVTAVESKWEGEFSVQERNGQGNWRWCGKLGVLRLINKSKDTAWVRLGATVTTGWPEDGKVQISSALFSDELTTNVKGLEWERVVALPPGESLVKFTSNAKRVATAPGESRVVVFALYDFTLTPVEAPAGGEAPEPLMQRPVEVTWGAGSYGEETGKLGSWHWCSATCEIALVNSSTTPAHVRITLGISTGHAKPARFIIKGPGISDTVPVIDSIRPLAYTLDLPPGKTVFKMSCDAPRMPAPGDPRNMVFMVSNFALGRVSGEAK
jgi:phosphoglycerol transferase